jgi:NhaA family Na+:H+ antiporter
MADLKSKLPSRPVEKLKAPVDRFLHAESTGGIVLAACTVIALAAANSPLADAFLSFWEKTVSISFDGFGLSYPLWYWINDGLMAVFFFLIGLEIKRELVEGELKEPRKIVLPAAAAVGGAAIPAIIFVLLIRGSTGQEGWAIPMATDIAFVVGCMALLGTRIPRGLKVFLLTSAIVDDIIAVIIIALFYSGAFKIGWFAAALVGFGVMVGLRLIGVRSVGVFVLVGSVIWFFTLKSGVHPTVAGVFMGLATPARPLVSREPLEEVLGGALDRLRGDQKEDPSLESLQFATREAMSPLDRLETRLHPWVTFAIMPIFALANAGVQVTVDALAHRIALAIALGLVLGKPLGIAFAAWLVTRFKGFELPLGTRWLTLVGVGSLAGIGFTMSLFIASLGLEGDLLASAKTGILLGSLISALVGFAIILIGSHKNAASD